MAKAKAAMATQFKRPNAKTQKRKAQSTVEIVRPWTTPQFKELTKEDRDIVLDRLQKEVIDVPATRIHAVRGVNQVARAVARREVKVVVFANNPESLAFGHLPLLCRLHQVPICVLHLSSKAFGRLFKLKSMVAVGIRAPMLTHDKAQNMIEEVGTSKELTVLTEDEQKKLASITQFLISKASKQTT
ncbi:Ribosomal protein L7Ae/L30e/S12e/Gadd45 [Plasmopara halstedii]|uniref:Ribosomal protein L7Ae/L30e/S12e/Gadd45 n=1 Tax=Plasmopara halstedii TaxID=4781 RepID=A0A0P1B1M9_PLAHL|nr:Ribosomal protein L7Ae/L30e/S12e/Gadd45 [Plasmopara halstedii]CEG47906.1 Ribosomal protein L7Ae/L30e/S12e/Gadd45 [Plasmopara halstedii]|eukprot:XP_024584275.1 Ribosomal protein L7Ae/L30e/S12e/Gadd45 [Plasmopara halstedii]